MMVPIGDASSIDGFTRGSAQVGQNGDYSSNGRSINYMEKPTQLAWKTEPCFALQECKGLLKNFSLAVLSKENPKLLHHGYIAMR